MTSAKYFIIGTPVVCADGPCGQLQRLVIDPEARALTLLGVQPPHLRKDERLVPPELVDAVAATIQLSCTRADFASLPLADPLEAFGPGAEQEPYGDGPTTPFQSDARRGFSRGGVADIVSDESGGDRPLTGVLVHLDDPVYTADGVTGRVQGFGTGDNYALSVLMVAEGVLWGKRLIAIPIGEVTTLEDGIEVRLTSEQVKNLQSVDIAQ